MKKKDYELIGEAIKDFLKISDVSDIQKEDLIVSFNHQLRKDNWEFDRQFDSDKFRDYIDKK